MNKDIAIICIAGTAILNSIALIKMGILVKKMKGEISGLSIENIALRTENKQIGRLANQFYKDVRSIKETFLKIRKELVNKKILTQELKYMSEDEAIEDFIDDFLES